MGFRVLVADDEPINCMVIEAALQPKGYDVVSARDGVEAVEQFRKNPADMVIMDLLMPRMSGTEAIKEIRKIDKDVPIVVITGTSDKNEHKRALENGAWEVIVKPFIVNSLNRFIRNIAPPEDRDE